MRSLWYVIVLAIVPFGAAEHMLAHAGNAVTFTENKGQWPDQVLYRAVLPGGALFVERSALTFVQYSGIDLHAHAQPLVARELARGHAYRVRFMGGEAMGHEGEEQASFHENHFSGADPSRWGTGCTVFGGVLLKGIWPGIDMRLNGSHGLKYDLILAPGADPAMIRLDYDGADDLELIGDEVHVHLTTGTVLENAPVAFQDGTVGRRPVIAAYALSDRVLSFDLPHGHDPTHTLVIDPVLTFSSFSGSTGNNFGFTATYDDEGHLYGGGIVFAPGYPTTMGAFDASFNQGMVDVGVSKWAPDGSSLVWSTYYGGSGADAPHSMVVNDQHELYVYGSTGSADLPTTPGCADDSFNGGPAAGFNAGYGFVFNSGADAFLVHFNADATALVGSTYVGGSGTDAVNNGALTHNYGDPFRGEVALDPMGHPVVATCSNSPDMPVTAGAPQPGHGGQFDGYVFRMDPGLTSFSWATYCGGTDDDTANGVQFNSSGDILVTGGTRSADLPMVGNGMQQGIGGDTDGYLVRYDPSGTMLAATYLGTSEYDQTFFVQIDVHDDVYVVGQTYGDYPVTPGVYTNPGSGLFIHKLDPDLSTTLWSTRLGNGEWSQDLSPSAFLVSDCGQIYFSGWAGNTNNLASPGNSTTNGLPTTSGAFQNSTDGSDFYLMVLEPDAVALSYATFFGGSSDEHVDGGTSRFDKNGKVYQAVCAGCGGGSFPTTTGAYSESNGASCNLGVFKFDLHVPHISISIAGDDHVCFPAEVSFENNSTGGNTWAWDFGDGSTSSEFEPTHTFDEPGTFVVTLVMTDQYGCAQSATDSLVVESLGPPVASIDTVPPICMGTTTQLFGSDGVAWQWSPPESLDDPTVQNPIASPDTTTTYQLVLTDLCGTDTAWAQVAVAQTLGGSYGDISTCLGDPVQLQAAHEGPCLWSPPDGLSDVNSPQPVANPQDTTTYTVTITISPGCVITDTVTILVVHGPPEPSMVDTAICFGGSLMLEGPVATTHEWSPAPGISDLSSPSPLVSPQEGTTYVVLATNACGQTWDSAHVEVVVPEAHAWPDTLVCPGFPVQLHASGGVDYAWSPTQGLNATDVQDPIATTTTPITYTVTTTDAWGCTDTASVQINLLPAPPLSVIPEVVIEYGDPAWLTAFGEGAFAWSPLDGVDCSTCATTMATTDSTTTYLVTITDQNGCTSEAQVLVVVAGSLYLPNVFTPNGDGVNDMFGALGREMDTFELWIYDRWGEEIFHTKDLHGRWDGTFSGQISPIGVYVWRVVAQELAGRRHERVGHVTLLR